MADSTATTEYGQKDIISAPLGQYQVNYGWVFDASTLVPVQFTQRYTL